MREEPRITLRVSEDDEDLVAYVSLRRPKGDATKVAKTVRLRELLGDYIGPDLFIDFDHRNALLGIELLD